MKLPQNESTMDRIVRIVLGVILLAAVAAGAATGPWLYVAGVVGVLALLTGLLGFCPLYALLRISTRPNYR